MPDGSRSLEDRVLELEKKMLLLEVRLGLAGLVGTFLGTILAAAMKGH
jgi:hypothetical protein